MSIAVKDNNIVVFSLDTTFKCTLRMLAGPVRKEAADLPTQKHCMDMCARELVLE